MRAALIAVLFVFATAGTVASQATPAASVYPPLDDVRDIWSRPWSLEDDPFAVTGEIDDIWVAPKGMGYPLLDDTPPFRTVFYLRLVLPDGAQDFIAVGYGDDPTGVNAGDTVAVGGVLNGEIEADDTFGIEREWPLMVADYVAEITDDATPAN
jgi:hypothetical protein